MVIKEEKEREKTFETMYEVDLLIDSALRRAEDGLRLINEMDEMLIHAADSKRFHQINYGPPSRSRRGSSSSDRDSVGESTAGHESSFESSESSGIGESIVSSTKNSIPILDFPIPSARNSRNRQVELERRHSFRAKDSKSCSSLSNSNQGNLYATIGHSGSSRYHQMGQDGHQAVPDPLSKSMSACDRVKINSKTPQNSPKTTDLINSFQRQNRGLYKQISDMRLEVNQLNSEIKSAGQTIRIKYARRNISQAFEKHKNESRTMNRALKCTSKSAAIKSDTILSLRLKGNANLADQAVAKAAEKSVNILKDEIAKLYAF